MKTFPNIQWESNFIFTVSGFFCRWWRLFMEWFFSPKDSLKGCQILWVSLIVPIIFWNGFFSILSRSYVCVIISFVWAVAFYISFGGHSEFVGFRNGINVNLLPTFISPMKYFVAFEKEKIKATCLKMLLIGLEPLDTNQIHQ